MIFRTEHVLCSFLLIWSGVHTWTISLLDVIFLLLSYSNIIISFIFSKLSGDIPQFFSKRICCLVIFIDLHFPFFLQNNYWTLIKWIKRCMQLPKISLRRKVDIFFPFSVFSFILSGIDLLHSSSHIGPLGSSQVLKMVEQWDKRSLNPWSSQSCHANPTFNTCFGRNNLTFHLYNSCCHNYGCYYWELNLILTNRDPFSRSYPGKGQETFQPWGQISR